MLLKPEHVFSMLQAELGSTVDLRCYRQYEQLWPGTGQPILAPTYGGHLLALVLSRCSVGAPLVFPLAFSCFLAAPSKSSSALFLELKQRSPILSFGYT